MSKKALCIGINNYPGTQMDLAGSVLAIDPKGELARITARARREKGQKV